MTGLTSAPAWSNQDVTSGCPSSAAKESALRCFWSLRFTAWAPGGEHIEGPRTNDDTAIDYKKLKRGSLADMNRMSVPPN